MQVDRVSATVRYSAEAKGAWRTMELGGEATVAPGESWKVAQASLYQDLGHQIKTLWSKNGSANGSAAQDAPEGHQVPVQPSNPQYDTVSSQQSVAHFCQVHGAPFTAKEGRYGQF
jgi:hypothetical protein